ncbi:hypothetical protein BJ322DRAFT_1113022 [Thelephora terrestris]|uniref:F-box domain-containing protein n=1 Tax=Thelephora terrestris TaxID=56493 RepID=A0A9P6H5X8_9AGAM|nr:hypothetical protein BJ322DRAFT_1113022 [Thelephora terrestris]
MPTLISTCLLHISPLSCLAKIAVYVALFGGLWRQTKTKAKLFVSSDATEVPLGPINKLPQELVEEILSYFVDDTRTLQACSLTCRFWYIAAVRDLHYSLTTDDGSMTSMDKKHWWPGPLEKMYELDLLPLVKRLRIRMWRRKTWFAPDRLDEHNLRYFSALENLQELGIDNLVLRDFMPDLQRCFGHLSSTLRFLALKRPFGSSRQIVCQADATSTVQ